MSSLAPDVDKASLRATVFGHIAGLVLVPTMRWLGEWGVIHLLTSRDSVTLDDVVQRTRGNRGYLRVAMRLLTAAGWIRQQGEAPAPRYTLTADGRVALDIAPGVYRHAWRLIPYGLKLDDLFSATTDDGEFDFVTSCAASSRAGWFWTPQGPHSSIYTRIRRHMDGLLAGPWWVFLARKGILKNLAAGPVKIASLGGLPSRWTTMFEFFQSLSWVTVDSGLVTLTQAGAYTARIAPSYGVPVSYLPLYHRLERLLFKDTELPRVDPSGEEVLVDRDMNVWGSGGAHTTYFKKVDEIVVDMFNRPIEEQPKGICDMGCGDGTFLEHLYHVIKEQTARGRMLDKYPLLIIGADFNEVSRRVTSRTLEAAGIPKFYVIHGDIGAPDQLAKDMAALDIDICSLLHVRSFLDHNRPFRAPAGYVPGSRKATTAGAFAQHGREIPADVLEENLVRHLRAWAPHTDRFGLLLLELHTLPPEVTAAHQDQTPALGYDGFHAYSDQYLVELTVFQQCLHEAGFRPDPRYHAEFPKSELATVSIDLLMGASQTS